MNLRRGFRRITFVLSVFVALTAAISCFLGVFDGSISERGAYNDSKDDYENITQFWLVWDVNGWEKYEVVKHLLSSYERPYSLSAPFDFGSGTVYLHPQDVFPGINKNMLYMPLAALDKEAQTAKEIAIREARRKVESYEYWGTKSTPTIILISIVVALVSAGLGYLSTWVIVWFSGMTIYNFFKWLILGFHDDKPVETKK